MFWQRARYGGVTASSSVDLIIKIAIIFRHAKTSLREREEGAFGLTVKIELV